MDDFSSPTLDAITEDCCKLVTTCIITLSCKMLTPGGYLNCIIRYN